MRGIKNFKSIKGASKAASRGRPKSVKRVSKNVKKSSKRAPKQLKATYSSSPPVVVVVVIIREAFGTDKFGKDKSRNL